MDGRLVLIMNSNLQVAGGSMVWWWCLLLCDALFLYSTLVSQLLKLSTFQGCHVPLPLCYLSACESDLGILPALGSIGMRGQCRFEGGLCLPCAVLGLNLLLTSVVAVPCVKFSVLQLHGSLWKISLHSREWLQGTAGSCALLSLRKQYTDLETGDVFQMMPCYTIFNLYFFRPFAVLWRVLDYWWYEIYLGYLEKKFPIF